VDDPARELKSDGNSKKTGEPQNAVRGAEAPETKAIQGAQQGECRAGRVPSSS
jgi:hypothetical protein